MQNKQLPISLLCVLGVGSMIGLGVFNLPSKLAAEANAGAILLSWLINICGLLAIVYVFKILSNKKRGNIGGLYIYSKTFAGDFGAALVGFAYYLSAIFAIVYFFQAGMQSLELIIPSIGTGGFGGGLNLTELLLSSIILWYMSSSMFKGILEIANISLVATAFKILPLILIIIAGFLSFDIANLTNISTVPGEIVNETRALEIGSFQKQITETTKAIIWLFVGFEGLSIISGRAYKSKDVGKAIVWSFCVTALLYFLVSLSCLVALPVEELAKLPPASSGFVLERLVGRWGQLFIDFSMIVSVFGAILIWCMFGVEILYLVSKDKLFFSKLGVEEDGVPKNAVLFTVITIQLMLIASYVFEINYVVFDTVMTTMLLLPYTITILYCVKYIIDEEQYEQKGKQIFDLTVTFISLVYVGWAMYATGYKLLMVSLGIYTFGVVIYIINRLSRRQRVFTKSSLIGSVVITLSGAISMFFIFKEYIL